MNHHEPAFAGLPAPPVSDGAALRSAKESSAEEQVHLQSGIASYVVQIIGNPATRFSRYINTSLQAPSSGFSQVGLGFSNSSTPGFSQVVGGALLEIELPLAMFGDVLYVLKNLNSASVDVSFDPVAGTLNGFVLQGLSQ